MTVNWLMVEILNTAGEVTYRNSFVTGMLLKRETAGESHFERYTRISPDRESSEGQRFK